MKKKKQQETEIIVRDNDVGMNYLKSLEEDKKYVTEVDPDGFYGMSEEHKQFVKLYIEYRNIVIVANILSLETETAKDYFRRYSTQQEIRRINTAIYHRQVATNIIGFEDIGSYLSSFLIGNDVTEADRLKTNEKLQVVKLLLDWHKSMKEFIARPETLTMQTIEEEIKELSVANIKDLINSKKLIKANPTKTKQTAVEKDALMKELKDNGFSEEEIAYLETLSVKELLDLLKDEEL